MTEEENEEKDWVLDLPLTKAGNSLSVVIPRKVLNATGLQHNDKVRVVLRKKEVE